MESLANHTLGTVNDVPVTISNGQDNDTILDEFSVVPRIIPIYSWDTMAVSSWLGTLSKGGI